MAKQRELQEKKEEENNMAGPSEGTQLQNESSMNVIMVIEILLATIAFQAALSLPGGV